MHDKDPNKDPNKGLKKPYSLNFNIRGIVSGLGITWNVGEVPQGAGSSISSKEVSSILDSTPPELIQSIEDNNGCIGKYIAPNKAKQRFKDAKTKPEKEEALRQFAQFHRG